MPEGERGPSLDRSGRYRAATKGVGGDLVETLETVNTGNGFNLINGALNVGPDDFLSYMRGRGDLWKKSA
jgi:hypothetical protein